jgi:hypothetical protein
MQKNDSDYALHNHYAKFMPNDYAKFMHLASPLGHGPHGIQLSLLALKRQRRFQATLPTLRVEERVSQCWDQVP